MSLCNCPEGPRCEAYNGSCDNRADGTCMVPLTWKPPLRLGPKFFCQECWDCFCTAWRTPMKGIDRPEGVDPEDWKPSILEHVRLAAIDMQINELAEQNRLARLSGASVNLNSVGIDLSRPGDERYTPAQLKQLYILRKHLIEERRAA